MLDPRRRARAPLTASTPVCREILRCSPPGVQRAPALLQRDTGRDERQRSPKTLKSARTQSRYALPASVKLTQTQRRPASRPSYQTLIPLRCPRGNLVLGFARMNPAQDHLPPNFGPHNMFTPDRSNPPYIVDRGVHPPDVPLRFDRRHVKRGISSQVECGTTCGGPRICAGVRVIVRIVSGQCSVCMMITAMIAMITGEGVGFSGKLWWVSEVV